MAKKRKLTDKQERFCQEYMIDLNATQACIRAGYSKKNADKIGPRMVGQSRVSERIACLKNTISEEIGVTAKFVLEGFKENLERSLQRKPVMEFDYKSKKMVQKKDEDGQGVWEYDGNVANKALENLGKHIGFYEKDNTQKPEMKTTIIVNSEETKSELEKLSDDD